MYLFAGFFLRVEAGGHDSLLAEADESRLHGQCQVRFVAIPRSRHRHVVVPRRCCRALLFCVQTHRIYNNQSKMNPNEIVHDAHNPLQGSFLRGPFKDPSDLDWIGVQDEEVEEVEEVEQVKGGGDSRCYKVFSSAGLAAPAGGHRPPFWGWCETRGPEKQWKSALRRRHLSHRIHHCSPMSNQSTKQKRAETQRWAVRHIPS